MKARGYSVDTYHTLQTAYYSPATPLQTASYGPAIIRIVKDGDADKLRELMQAGLHPNCCNNHSESLLHMACRRGYIDVVKVFLEFGANLQVSDDYGRTPMHDACWQNEMNFQVVEEILKVDNRLFYMLDCRGSLPLSYVHKDHFEAWQEFLTNEEMLDKYFPKQAPSDEAPDLCKLWPNARPLQDPKGALSSELAQMVANGKVDPADAVVLAEDISTVAEESESDDSYDSDYDSSDDEDDDELEADQEIIQLALSSSDLKFWLLPTTDHNAQQNEPTKDAPLSHTHPNHKKVKKILNDMNMTWSGA